MKKLKISVILFFFMQTLFAQNNSIPPTQIGLFNVKYWSSVSEASIINLEERQIIPNNYKVAKLDVNKMRLDLISTVLRTVTNFDQGVVVELPNPEGTFSKFLVYKNTTMSSGLEAKFPEIRSYDVVSINSSGDFGKIDITPHGFHAMVFSVEKGTMFIDPYAKGNTEDYLIYYKKDFTTTKAIDCGVIGQSTLINNLSAQKTIGNCDLKTYRLALAATGEYTAFHGGTVPLALAAEVTSMNRVNGIFERGAQITMTIVANNNLLIYTNGATDPYTNNDGFAMLTENQTNIDAIIGSGNYDIGHVFSTGGGGVAALQSPCGAFKAEGVTGQGSPIGDPFDIDYVAHEMGHQWGANHTQNNGCSRNDPTAVEPGSASTIMGYAGICPPNVQGNSDDYFHGINVAEMSSFISLGGGCAVTTAVVNVGPTITGTNGNVTIPANTPFMLTATATDPNAANVLSYCWEQMDNQVSTQPPVAAAIGGPNFRSFSPTTSPTRYFPNLTDIIAGTSPTWEVLSSVNRTMNFRVTVRDNAGPLPEVGCINNQDVTITVDAASGPFVETYPSIGGITWTGLTSETVTWNEAGTAGAPVSCANVDILLSTDGGLTYSTVLVSNTPNDGTQSITVPNISSATARVMIVCSNGTFFDISDNNFTITAPAPPPTSSVCIDTVFYPHSKMTAFDGFQLMEEGSGGRKGISQTYNANTGLIHGINAYVLLDTNGIVGDAAPLDVFIKVTNVDALNRPTTTIGSSLVTITDIGTAQQTLMFAAPIAVSGRYAITVEFDPVTSIPNSDTLYYRTNNPNATPPDGGAEGLFAIDFAFGLGWTNLFLQFAGQPDVDALLAPIFEKTIQATYTTDVDTVCLGDNVVFTNTATLDTNYMYNRWDLLNTDPWIWDYADGTGTYNHFDTTYTYGSGGSFNSQLLITNYGYTVYCVDSVQKNIEVIGNVVASPDTGLCSGGAVNLSATGAVTYNWDNGLGAGANQTAIPLSDTMYVVTGTGLFGCISTDTVDVLVSASVNLLVNADTIVCNGTSVNLMATGATNYLWDNGLGAGANQTITPTVDTLYTVVADDGGACTVSDSVFVAIAPCNCIDTVFYPTSKMTAFDGFQLMEEGSGGRKGISQTFNSNTGLIHGINAFVFLDTNGIAGDAAPLDVYIKVTNVDGLNRPTTTIDSAMVTVADIGNQRQTLLFKSPVAVSGRYAITIGFDPLTSIPNSDTLYYRTNSPNATPPDGGTEGLFAIDFAFGLGWTNLFLQFAGQPDVDALLAPIFDKTISSSYTTDVDTVCLGSDVVFTNTSTLDTTYMYNRWDSLNTDPWVWNYADGTGTYNHFDTTYTYSAGGTYNTQLLITNYGYSGNCVDSVQKVIEVIGSVTASVDTAVCLGDSVNLSATGSVTYNWDNGLGAGANQTAAPIVDTMYVVTGTGLFSCISTDTVNVTVNSLPSVVASVDTTICAGDTANISATSTVTPYIWDNGLPSVQQHQVTPSLLTDYIVTVTDLNGCSDDDTVTVTVNALPVLTTSNDTTLCAGDSITIFSSGAVSYIWDNNINAGDTHLILPIDTTYMVEGTASNGCIGLDSVVVTVKPLPIVLANNDTSICSGTSITLIASGATILTWDNSLGSGQTHDVSPTEQTVYIVIGDENGCIGSDTVIVSIDNCFEIPNVFTPNGDGKNDLWNIGGLELYPDILVKVFNRWGDLVFESEKGYVEPWDGTYNGTTSPSATYYYVIDLGNGEEGSVGTINIIR